MAWAQPAAAFGAAPFSLTYDDIAAAIEKRLFIGKVPPGTTDEELRSVYEGYGALTECRVVPDRNGGTGNGIGFVGFSSWNAAHRALVDTDGKRQLRGHEGTQTAVVASFAERTRSGRGGGVGVYAKGLDISRVFVGSLPEDTQEEELTQAFASIAAVDSVKMLPARGRLRCAFVQFQTWGEAFDAVENLHGQPLRNGGEELMTVTLAEPREGGGKPIEPQAKWQTMQAIEPPAKWRRIDPGPADIDHLLSTYSAAVKSDSPESTCNFLHEQMMKMRRQSAAPAAIKLATKLATSTSLSSMSAAGPIVPGAGSDGGRLFIGGLPNNCSDGDLLSLASQLKFSLPPASCQLTECRVLAGRGCGFLCYSSGEAAQEAFESLQGRTVDGWSQALRVQWAAPKPAQEGQAPEQQQATDIWSAVTTDQSAPPDPLCLATKAEVEAQGLEPTRLFVGHIARDSDPTAALSTLFQSFGPLLEFRFVQEKGILYVAYATFEEAQAAMKALNSAAVPKVSAGLNVRFSMKRY